MLRRFLCAFSLFMVLLILISCTGSDSTNIGSGSDTLPVSGTLDTSFGSGGKVTTTFGTGFDGAYAAAVQSDGKIVAAGYSGTDTANVFALARYKSDGTLDSSFGSGGKVTTAFGSVDDRAFAVAIQTDGKIIAAGYSNTETTNVFALVRYNSDGTLDSSFGTAGLVTTAFGTVDDRAHDLVIQTDGKIILVGYSNNGTADIFALVRYSSDGSLDTNFGSGGKVTATLGTFRDRIDAVKIQSDGKIVAAGHSDSQFALARFSSTGSLDTGFGSGGKVITTFGAYGDYAHSVAIEPDGKIVAAGWSNTGTTTDPVGSYPGTIFALARYNTDGTLDTSFGVAGKTTTDFGTIAVQAFDIAMQQDGKIVAAGWSITHPDTSYTYAFSLSRYNTDGTLDMSFGTGGKLITAFGSSVDYACAVDIQTDGKIVATGLSWTSTTSSSVALARYWP